MASKQLSHLKKVNRQSLQLEVKLVARLLYKNKNQRRREKDFQKLRKVIIGARAVWCDSVEIVFLASEVG